MKSLVPAQTILSLIYHGLIARLIDLSVCLSVCHLTWQCLRANWNTSVVLPRIPTPILSSTILLLRWRRVEES